MENIIFISLGLPLIKTKVIAMTMLKIKKKVHDTFTVITPVGEIDVQKMLQLKNFFNDLEKDSVFRVAIDMGGVTFIDSYGVSVLTNFFQRVKSHKGWFVFFNCKKETRDVLRITGVDQVIPVYKNLEEIKKKYQK